MIPLYLDDIFQIANPMGGLIIATIDNRDTDYLLSYIATMGIVGLSKYAGTKTHYYGSRRPDKTAYTGMPSGHTASAWFAASYTRNPIIYCSAFYTALARVTRGKHHWYQVCASIALCEFVVLLNSKYNLAVKLSPIENGISISYRF